MFVDQASSWYIAMLGKAAKSNEGLYLFGLVLLISLHIQRHNRRAFATVRKWVLEPILPEGVAALHYFALVYTYRAMSSRGNQTSTQHRPKGTPRTQVKPNFRVQPSLAEILRATSAALASTP